MGVELQQLLTVATPQGASRALVLDTNVVLDLLVFADPATAPLPDLLAKDKALGDLLQTVHLTLNFVLIAVLLGHVGAALKHHFIDKDDVMTRMLPRRAD